MKKLVVFFMAVALSSTTLFANNDMKKGKEEGTALRTEISNMLNDFETEKSVEADISFMINKKGEIIVLSVDSKNEKLESFVKATLNYKSVKNVVSKRMKVFRLPFKIIKE